MKKTIVTILVITILTTAGLALAQGWGRGWDTAFGPCPRMNYGPISATNYWAGDLNLTPEQMQKIQALREAHWQEVAPLQNELRNKQLELRSLWMQPSPEQEKIVAKQKEVNALREKIQEKAAKNRLEMRQILTPDQQAKLETTYGFGAGPGFGRKGGFNPNRGLGYGPCFW